MEWKNDLNLLEELITMRSVSGDERPIRDFLLATIEREKKSWKVEPEIHFGDGFQDCIVLTFGTPKTAMYAHIDSIGYTVGYQNELIKVGGPKPIEDTLLVGSDSKGEIEVPLMVIEDEQGNHTLKAVSDRTLDRGTCLSYKPDFILEKDFLKSPYIDNRMGVFTGLQVARTLENGAIVFSCYEEHGGGTVGYLGKFLYEQYGVMQSLICDITWKTSGIEHGKGVALSMRDSGIPRRVFLDKVVALAKASGIPFQLEVESAGGSDGNALQKSSYPIDWVFVGAPEDHVHTPHETIHLDDVDSMIRMYQYLMKELNE